MSSENQGAESQQQALKEKLRKAPILMIGEAQFTLEPEELNEEYQARAAKEIRETPENYENGIKVLRELLKGEPDLKVPTDTEFLQKFLRPCKWYPDSAFELMKRFYKYRQSHPRYCDNLIPKNERAVLLSGILTPLPRRTADGVRVILIEGGRKWKPKEISLEQLFRGVILYLEAAMAEPISQVAGVRVMLDMDGLSLSQVTYFTPSFAGAVADFVQRCLPCRLKGIHIVNQPIIFNMVFAFFKPFLHEKIRKRIHFHGSDKNSLLPYFDAKCLPKQYGGELKFPDEPVGESLIKYLNYFEEDFIASSKHGYISKQ